MTGNESETYKIPNKERLDIIETNLFLCETYISKVEDEKIKTLPFIYWLPKMHYVPSRARFIVASSACSTKPLSKLASQLFKQLPS